MHISRWASCAQITTLSLGTILAAQSASAQAAPNPPKLQKALEAAARKFKRVQIGSAIRDSVTVGDHMLIVNYAPAPGADPAFVLKSMRETNWKLDLCASKDALAFMDREGVTVRITLTLDGQPATVISDVTAASCASEPGVSRIIGGASFAPKPTDEEAEGKIKAYIRDTFKDPDSALVKCSGVGDAAWIKPAFERRRYGYFVRCEINGKNAYGGYVGYETYVFRLNGDEFERIEAADRGGLMEPEK